MGEFFISKEVRKAAPIVGIGMFAASLVIGYKKADAIVDYFATSPEETIANATRVFAESGATPDNCYPGMMGEGGVTGDLIDEIRHNDNLDIDELDGFPDAGRAINEVLSAQHEIADSDHNHMAQTGDYYEYCVLEDGTVILGDPSKYIIVNR